MKRFLTFKLLVICLHSSATIYTVTDTGITGVYQFMNFVNQANAANNLDTIYFNVVGLPPYNIDLNGVTFPSIDSPIFIDGFSQ